MCAIFGTTFKHTLQIESRISPPSFIYSLLSKQLSNEALLGLFPRTLYPSQQIYYQTNASWYLKDIFSRTILMAYTRLSNTFCGTSFCCKCLYNVTNAACPVVNAHRSDAHLFLYPQADLSACLSVSDILVKSSTY